MIIIIIVLALLAGISIYFNLKLLKKIETSEEIIASKTDDLESMLIIYSNILNKMKEIDSRGSFEADDEVGVTFTLLKEAIEEGKAYLVKFITNEDGTSDR
jgi:hypothetical protein